jgi:hypothetical protein
MRCPNCDFFNIPGSARCARCESTLDFASLCVDPPRRSDSPLAPLRVAAAHSRIAARQALGVSRAAQVAAGIDAVPWPAVFRSIIPGWGLRSLGHSALGWFFTVAWLFILPLAIIFMGDGLGLFFASLLIGIHSTSIGLILAPVNAPFSPLHRAGIGLITYALLIGGLYLPVRWVIHGFVVPLQLDGLPPHARGTLLPGDVLLLRGRWIDLPPRRGDIVVYNHPGFAATAIVFRGGTVIDRVLALPGDTALLTPSSISVNGTPIPPTALPLGPTSPADSFSVSPTEGQLTVFATTLGVGAIYAGLQPEAMRRAGTHFVQTIPADAVQGTVLCRWRPFSRAGRIDPPSAPGTAP